MVLNILFILSSLLVIGGGLAVVITKNIVHSCVFLLATLLGTAGLYASMGADFVAVAQIMVYVGGVVILVLFAVMLTGGQNFVSKAQQLLGLAPSMGNKWTFAVGILTAIVFMLANGVILKGIASSVTLKDELPFFSTVEEIGYLLVTDHLLAFELSSVLLLGALVGAAIIARPRRD